MRNCNKIVTEQYFISLCDLDHSDLKPHQKVEVHARHLHAKYVRDQKNIEGPMRNCNKIVMEKSINSLGDLDPSDLKPHQKVHGRYLYIKYVREWLNIKGAMRNCNKSVTEGRKEGIGRKEGRKEGTK
ncbi:hypothetical protein DPMN_080019 [Dreissena polymorpha]|uniref:Uncharacterized protein n=1 Tax=Dreissena polymorpha TaxID=45954 RepID=A0A9D4BTH1_DREPO|nr:hypothetical protein DPMN_080019 [Dreissena polymorpha]